MCTMLPSQLAEHRSVFDAEQDRRENVGLNRLKYIPPPPPDPEPDYEELHLPELDARVLTSTLCFWVRHVISHSSTPDLPDHACWLEWWGGELYPCVSLHVCFAYRPDLT